MKTFSFNLVLWRCIVDNPILAEIGLSNMNQNTLFHLAPAFINLLGLEQYGCYSADDILKCIFFDE